MACPHCGSVHATGTTTCPKTGERMDQPGAVGTRIDRYEVRQLLGSGGFGAVYRARHVHTDAEVALKVLKPQLNADQGMIDRFLREAKAAAAVGSEHIVRIMDAGIAPAGTAFLAMELLDGWDLKELIQREGPQNPRRLVAIILQVLDGLAAAHAKGIVHRDMKPANVFVTRRVTEAGVERDFVKLLDFGISKMQSASDVAGLTMTGMAMGTPGYMAPEQFFDARSVDARADIYSVAVMLFELLTSRLPFEAQSYADLIVKVKTELPPALLSIRPQLPATLGAAVDRGLAKDKAARWQSARDFADSLRSGLRITGETPAPRPTDTGAPRVAPVEMDASLMFGKTSTPMPAGGGTPAAAAPSTAGDALPSGAGSGSPPTSNGWVVPAATGATPAPFRPPVQAPPAVPIGAAAPMQPSLHPGPAMPAGTAAASPQSPGLAGNAAPISPRGVGAQPSAAPQKSSSARIALAVIVALLASLAACCIALNALPKN